MVQNIFDNVGRITWFLGGSAKRKQILLEATGGDADDGLMELLKASEESNEALSDSFDAIQRGSNAPFQSATRWTARVTPLSALLPKYCPVIQALERILADCSRGDTQIEARAHLSSSLE